MDEKVIASEPVPDFYRYWGKAKRDDVSPGPDYHLLAYHSLDVAACGWLLMSEEYPYVARIAETLGIDEHQLRRLFVLFLCLHDLGKFARAFQGLAPGLSAQLVAPMPGMSYEVRHDSLGFWLWRESAELQDVFAKAFNVDQKQVRRLHQLDTWLEIVTGHHGQPPQYPGNIRLLDHFDKSDIASAVSFSGEMLRWWLQAEDLGFLQDKALNKELKSQSWCLAGLAVLADWLGSNQRYFGYCAQRVPLKDYWEESALPSARKALAQSGLQRRPVQGFESIRQLFPFVETPTPLQHYAISQPLVEEPQLFILEDVTGAGKTEAAMVLVHRLMSVGLADGLYVGLPTMATANAMYGRMAECYRALYPQSERPSLILAHGARHLSAEFSDSVGWGNQQPSDVDYASGEASASAYCNAWFADNRKKALLADIGVGTIDQGLLGVLPARHQSLRLVGLSRKVLLIDEVHAYDPYMKKLLENLLEMHAGQGGSAILLSATLPYQMKRDLIAAYAKGTGKDMSALDSTAYPLATQFPAIAEPQCALATRPEVARRVEVQRLNGVDAALALIAETVAQGQCVCWIRNTVDDARWARQQVRNILASDEVVQLFHSRYVMLDRQNIEADVLARFGKHSDGAKRKGRVLVSTQVVEQSLDLDFDVLISDLAPIDLLLQRAGRLHRHRRDAQGNPVDSPGEADQRPPAVFYVHSPDPQDDADENWLDGQKGTLAVYRDLGQLWRSAKVLFSRGGYRMPEDARELIESVYSSATSLITPEAIEEASFSADGDRRAAASMAGFNMLDMSKGYTRKSNDAGWGEEVNVPTRLSDASVSVVLVKPDGEGSWRAYAEHPHYPWDLSTVSMRENLWRQAEKALSSELIKQMADLQENHNALKWKRLFPLAGVLDSYYDQEVGWLGGPAEAGNGQ
ncbi:CRISPR-associated helicase Cas3' [Spongiibacter taiwanensis]|uniref:CRISPR-associated helicase Cas3' n=1 Tax=Spongiibacter taiwanensis TaxID=1748242 RepID=UPI002034B381|nr:CRISPR-associated helicase Cas3' [Spongiibacter taiwanensis]USA43085.1 CRISPR-associated helicase Cas3' [Spongiibacter taiwanensis]